ncbi:MAG TPA: GAF domain-containing protein [Thermoleophilia bacterium]|nr:GAF domain-containing protein [Thermoleophilia bacterium]
MSTSLTDESEQPTWLRVADVARLLGVSANTVRRWTDAGRIPARRSPGGHRRYLLDEMLTLGPDMLPPAPAVRQTPPAAASAVLDPVMPGRQPPAPVASPRPAAGQEPGTGLGPLAELASVLCNAPEELPRRAARLLRDLADVGRCEILAVEGDQIEVIVSVDAGGEDATRVGRRRPSTAWPPHGDDGEPVTAVVRRSTARAADAAALRERSAHALLWAPMVVGDQRFGALELIDARDRDLTPYVPMAQTVASLVGHALDVTATKTALAQRRRTMRELIALSQDVAWATDLHSFAQTVAERIMTTTNADYVDLWQVQGAQLHALVGMSRDGVDAQHAGATMDLDKYPACAVAFAAGAPFVVASLRDERLTPGEVESYRQWGYQSSLSMPIMVGGEMVGLIELYDDAERSWDADVDFIANVSQHVAGLFANAVLLDEVRRRAAYERELVGLAEELSQAQETRELARVAAATLRRVADAEDCDIWHLDEGRLRCLISVDRGGVDTAVEGKLLDLDRFPTTADAARGRETLVVADLHDPRLTPEEVEDWAEFGFRSCLTLPLVAGDEVVGLIDLFDTRERTYAEARKFVVSAGRMVADALKKAQLLASLQQSNRGLRELLELGDVVAGAEDLDALVRIVAERLRAVLRAEDCDIWRVEEGRLLCLASVDSNGWDENEVGLTRELTDYPGTLVALERDEPIVIGDLDLGDDALTESELAAYERWGYRSMVSLPLVLDGRPVGLIDIFDTRPRDWGDLLDFIRNVGALVAGAFDKAVLLERLENANRELRVLVEASLDFGATLDLDAVIDTVARRIRDVTGADICDIHKVDGDEVEILASVTATGHANVKGRRYSIADFRTFSEARATRAPVLRPDVFADVRTTPQERADAEEWGYAATADVPLIVSGDVIGFATVYRNEPGHFPQMDAVIGLAQIAAQAIANASLYRDLDDNARRLAMLSESMLELTSTLDLDEVLARLARRLCAAIDVPVCQIHVLEGEDLVTVMRLNEGVVERDHIGSRWPLRDAGATREVMRTRRPTVVRSLDDPRLSERAKRLSTRGDDDHPILGRCWAVLPLITGDEVIGVVELAETRGSAETRESRAFTSDELEAAASICHAAAMALTNARLFAQEQAARREADVLNELGRAIAASLDLGEIADATARHLKDIIEFDAFALMLQTDGKVTDLITGSGERYPFTAADFNDIDPGFGQRLAREGLLVLDLPDENPLRHPHPAMRTFRQMVVLALPTDPGVVGIVLLASRSDAAFDHLNRDILMRVASRLSLAVANARLYEENKAMHLGNLKALSSTLNAKDYYTLGHAARVAAYMVMLGEELGWPEEQIESVLEAAYLHDIGKISIPDRVLLKPGRLNDREWEQMRQHPALSADIIRPLFPEELVLGVRHHHEKYDGSGYPDGLSGEQIPWLARAMAVVDAYDAMSCRRPYKAALSYLDCLEELERCRGTQFDPAMLDAFRRVLERVFERRNMAARVAAQAADRIPGEWHTALHGPEDEGGEEYRRIAQVLREVRDANPPTRFLTTHCRLDRRYVIAVDPEEDEGLRSHFGDEVFADDDLRLTLDGRVPDVNVLYADEYGVWVTGLAPIRDTEGNVVAAAAADLPAIAGRAGESLTADARLSFASMLQPAVVRVGRIELDAITDGLTGLYNHRYLHERLHEELERARRLDCPLAVLICDLDQFAEYNERSGYSAGDEALRDVAHIIEESVRTIDIAARYSGEEFAVALVDTARPEALAVAERLRARLERAALGADGANLTVSIGVACFPDDATRREELLDKASRAMRAAKRQGRNRVVSFTFDDAADGPRARRRDGA